MQHKTIIAEQTNHNYDSDSSIYSKYRADIDGMRAIAVLSVIGFHAFPTNFKGGFVGVDIFFIISGFLISTIIFSSLNNNKFGFIEFYSRRIKRIFPSLLVVLVGCYIFGWFTLLANEYKQLGKHILSGAGFISNLILRRESGYFDNLAETKPLLHLWSLGIEEQFYIIWPLMLWLFWKKRFNLLTVTVLICLLSFILNIQGCTNVVAVFYSPQTRFWELLLGAFLAWFKLCKHEGSKNLKYKINNLLGKIIYSIPPKEESVTILSNTLSLIGCVLLTFSLLFITKEKIFPGWWAILPTFGTVFIIAAGPDAWINRKILANGMLVWFGLISFPLYLWHWPLLSFAYIMGEKTPSDKTCIVAIVLSVILAWLTYILIEKPIRYGKHSKTKVIILVTLMFLIGCVGYYTYKQDGLRFRYNLSENDSSIRSNYIGGNDIVTCNELVAATSDSFCAKAKDSPINVAVIGDSHTVAIFNGLIRSNHENYKRAMVIGAGGCQASLDMEARQGCNNLLKIALDQIKNTPSITTVVMAGYQGFIDNAGSDTSKKFLEGYNKTIQELRKAEKKIIVVIDHPALKLTAELCAPKPFKIRQFFYSEPTFCTNATESDVISQQEYRLFIDKLKVHNPDVLFLETRPLFYQNEKYMVFNNKKLLYGDWNHLSFYGGNLVANELIAKMALR